MTTQHLITTLQQQPRSNIPALFAADANRFSAFSRNLDDLLLDFSKTSIRPDDLQQLLKLAEITEVEKYREAMFRGEKINHSEGRAVLHTALRANADSATIDPSIIEEVHRSRDDMLEFAEQCRNGNINAADGAAYTDVINIGIGGSDLGPAMAVAALAPYRGDLRLHFVSNMDGAHLADTLATVQAARTLVIISSKTFTTTETINNAQLARQWLMDALGEAAANQQTIAITAASEKAQTFGIGRIFPYWDWVGGRYSLWGAVGLPIALAIGKQNFAEFLRGAAAMDTHFRTAAAIDNLPLLFALVGIWHRNICGYPTRAILPYDQRLHLLPAYLQQLEMESNGKCVANNNQDLTLATVPVVWGSAGTNAQHAYFQMLHQGSDIVPGEFMIAAQPIAADAEQHKLLVANALAQTAALMQGDASAAEKYRHFPGNRPSVTIMYEKLTPYALGRLLALYEHRTFVEGIIWGINPFDQWGVELGKTMAKQLRPQLETSPDNSKQDSSTQGLIKHYQNHSKPK
ncbi:MAG: glucose-6-phosphate isomerase [Proteobacteria bacterium]|nr:glucose-6-phosphate isomerase [Pseudomonadota bacterium]